MSNFGKSLWNKKNQEVQISLVVVGCVFAVIAWACFSNEAASHGLWGVFVTALSWITAANIESKWEDRPHGK